ncbi:FAD-dependent oxidoreductase [Candidatus Gracilibacteria bacterium]|nr:FAD-dependent oxidoreductase [Candidatus Gracilibacteria bacterium]
MEQTTQIWDTIIIGTGVAGLSAGMYCGRFNMKTLVIGELPGGIITTTHLVENYPGIPSITGSDMGMVFLEHAQKFGATMEFARVNEVTQLPPAGPDKVGLFKVKTTSKEFVGKTVMFATGTEYKKLGVPGEAEFYGKGVSYCALCDGAFFKQKTVSVVGGGDSSAIESLIMAQHAAKVYHFVRKDVLRAEPINFKRMMENPKIEVRYNTEIAEIKGEGNKVTAVVLKSGETLQMDGVFVAVGHLALSAVAKGLGVMVNEAGEIKIDRKSQTNIPGVYGSGDVCDGPFKQAITGAAEAVVASYYAYQYTQQKSF